MGPKTKILGWVGIIFLGALGSALWEVMKPLLDWAWSGAVTISTLGLDSVRDSIYETCSETLGRPTGTRGVYLGIVFFISSMWFLTIQMLIIDGLIRRSTLLSLTQLLIAVAMIITSVRVVHASYANELAYDYERLETIAAPHLTDKELKEIRARLALMKHRQEYIEIMYFLSSRIQKAGIYLPSKEYL